MQINFWMADSDRALFHEYIFSKNGYITPEKWIDQAIPIASLENQIDIDLWLLKIFKEDLFPKNNFNDYDWVTFHNPTQKYHIHGPGMEYMKSYTKNNEIIRGRIYMGTVDPVSFAKPNERNASVYQTYKDDYKKLENFYQSCTRFIKKHYRRAPSGFYHGPHSDQLEKEGMAKVDFPGMRPVNT